MNTPNHKPRGRLIKIDWQKCREIAIAEIGKNPWSTCLDLARAMGVSAFTARNVAFDLNRDGIVNWMAAKNTGVIERGLEKLCSEAVFGHRLTLEEIANGCGVTRQSILNIERSALRKIRQRLTKEDASALLGFLRGN